MIAAYLLRAIAIGMLIAAAASLLDYAVSAARKPRRFVWLLALVVATLVPVIELIGGERIEVMRTATSGERASTRDRGTSDPSAAGDARSAIDRASDGNSAPFAWLRHHRLPIPAWFDDLDRPLSGLWLAGSLLWGAILVASAVRIHGNRRQWREVVLDGMPVYLSHDVGPALFGLTRFGIVLPSWVTGLDEPRRRLIVAHEREHARAADNVTLLAGALFVLVQPLNPMSWAMFRRLRLAIEIDCDARVLAQARDARTYGDLLIDMGERTLAGAAPVAALSEGGSQLARRIHAISKRGVRRPVLRPIGALGASVLLAVAAWQVPVAAPAGAQEPTVVKPAGARSGHASPQRAIVRVHSVGLNKAGPTPTILVWAERGRVQFATGTDSLRPLIDTVRLDRLPAMRFDVTDGDAVVAVEGPGILVLGAEVEGGAARKFTAAGPRITLLRGGTGVANGDQVTPLVVNFDSTRLVPITDDVVWKLVRERYPSMVDGPLSEDAYVWLLIDGDDRLIGSNRGLGELPRAANGRLGNLQSSGVRRMLPGMAPQLRPGEAWGWKRLPIRGGDTLNVIWVRQLYPAATQVPE